MPNNFKLTGDYYVSKYGSDSNNGLTPDTPKRTIQAAINLATSGTRTIIVGSGVYTETFAILNINVSSLTIKSDGYCVLESNSTNTAYLYVFSGGVTFDGFEIRRYSNFSIGFGGASFNPGRLINCVVKNSELFFNDYTFPTINTVFINCNLNIFSANNTFILRSCTLINCKIGLAGVYNSVNNTIYNGSVSQLIDCSLCNSVVRTTPGIQAAQLNYNNFLNSVISIQAASTVTSGVIQDTYGRYYDLSIATSTGDGTIGNPYGRPYTNGAGFNFVNHRIAYPTMNASSSAVDPKFNSVEDQDFTLQAGSPMIGRASDGISNIGGTKYALRRTSRISFSGSQAAVDPSLIFQYDNYIISGSQVTGSVTSAPIAVNTSAPKVIQKVTYNGLLAFNKDTGSASGSNQNVPDFDTFTSASGNAAANPDRLVYYMRHTTGSSIPVTDANWDNGGLWTAGQYNVFEWNTKPSIDNNGVGNGSGSFNAAVSPTYIQATYVQMQVKLRNDYLL